MKKLLLLIPLAFLSIPAVPAPVQAQQMTVYQSCMGEVYFPGYYDRYGNFVQGGVSMTRVPCGGGGGGSARICNPEAGSLLGLGIAGAIAGGEKYNYNTNYSATYSRGGYSSSSNSNYSNNNYWKALGAGAGAILFGC
jgi:hypothetical protein